VNGRTVLSTLDMPVLSGTTRYAFNYNGSGQLTSVDAPSPSGSGYRTTYVTPDATTGRIASIKDPSGDSVRFGYDGTITRRMTSRIDRRGHTTTVAYSGDRVSGSTVNPGGLGLTTTFQPLEVVGRSGWTRTDEVMTSITTPRTDLTAKIHFTAAPSGSVDRMVDATGRETFVTYGNSTFPALPTRVRDPSRFVTEAVYNARGLVDTVKAINPLGTSQNALTSYQWHSTLDLPTRITSPLGDTAGYGHTNSVPLQRQP
jgi:YD repeat-containing protein